jgi:hypothetical protein
MLSLWAYITRRVVAHVKSTGPMLRRVVAHVKSMEPMLSLWSQCYAGWLPMLSLWAYITRRVVAIHYASWL